MSSKFLSTTLFWPESVKIKRARRSSSALTKLSALSVLKLFWIAVRPSREGRSFESKRAIKRISEVQAAKFIILSIFIFLSIYVDKAHEFYLIAPFVIIPFIDWYAWDVNLEDSLIKELKIREVELGLAEAEKQLSREAGPQTELVSPPDVDFLDDLHERITKEAQQAGLETSEFLRRSWEERAGIKSGTRNGSDDQYKALKSYLDS